MKLSKRTRKCYIKALWSLVCQWWLLSQLLLPTVVTCSTTPLTVSTNLVDSLTPPPQFPENARMMVWLIANNLIFLTAWPNMSRLYAVVGGLVCPVMVMVMVVECRYDRLPTLSAQARNPGMRAVQGCLARWAVLSCWYCTGPLFPHPVSCYVPLFWCKMLGLPC